MVGAELITSVRREKKAKEVSTLNPQASNFPLNVTLLLLGNLLTSKQEEPNVGKPTQGKGKAVRDGGENTGMQ